MRRGGSGSMRASQVKPGSVMRVVTANCYKARLCDGSGWWVQGNTLDGHRGSSWLGPEYDGDSSYGGYGPVFAVVTGMTPCVAVTVAELSSSAFTAWLQELIDV